MAQATLLAELYNAKWYLPVSGAGYYNDIEAMLFPAGKKRCQKEIKNLIYRQDSRIDTFRQIRDQ